MLNFDKAAGTFGYKARKLHTFFSGCINVKLSLSNISHVNNSQHFLLLFCLISKLSLISTNVAKARWLAIGYFK